MSMRDFSIINKIGNISDFYDYVLMIIYYSGDGAYSVVYKVKRLSDG